ncbi:monovalent cation:proton antiporter-2 (CPA2) family protein [Reinekea marinisedimentorum]|uniref:Glutathione-regulated potassium-efflux system ancillary protein KefC n=1 Tax=Reinekea marinisedimentorum TaxID=230495 RepID=A0A4V2UKE3_9GAMM|nr:monovalent cation:proton antiporter-2 (CPA2) family protein [Reinekea marinisedimentorum]TCS44063.1 glutathione-regulated potassium-efflux system ancillary protein KefC [Reinekea marinisedimentorum]
MTTEHNYFMDALVFLGAAVVFVPVAKRAGLGSVLGYLVGGIAIGPYLLGLIEDSESILHFSEFGVVLLLFLIGLELNPGRLWGMRRQIFGLGGTQVMASAALLAAIALLFNFDWRLSLVAAFGLALSSTAIALQTLEERKLMATGAGQNGFAVLLFQDIAVIPMIALLPLLATTHAEATTTPWLQVLKAVAAIAVIILGGHFALTPILKRIASLHMREMFTAFSLALVIGIAQLMDYVGLSMALGTFLAGVLLADSEYRHELEIDIEPFKGLLMGLFFMAVGMSIDFNLLVNQLGPVVLLAVILIAVKALVLYALAWYLKMSNSDRLRFTAVLAQGGEFAFVLFSLATSTNIISLDDQSLLVLAVVISMICTPLLVNLVEYIIVKQHQNTPQPQDEIEENNGHILICGYGRYGQVIGRMLHGLGHSTTLLDSDPNQIELVRKFGFKVFFGDATRLDLLEAAGIGNARAVILTMDDQQLVTHLTGLIRKNWPSIVILARARNRQHAVDLYKAGANDISRETFSSALELGSSALNFLGMSKHNAWRAAQKFRHYDEKLLAAQFEMEGDEDTLIQLSHRSRRDLEEIYRQDQSILEENDNEWT